MFGRVPRYKIISQSVYDRFADRAPSTEFMISITTGILIDAHISVIYASFIFYKTIILNQLRFWRHTLRLSDSLNSNDFLECFLFAYKKSKDYCLY